MFFNHASREIILKIVYYGPGLCGKTTNIKYISEATRPEARGKLITLETTAERTLFFDFLPISLPPIRGYKTRLHLYTVPGQVFYAASRRLIMKGADGVIFVADSQEERFEANLVSMEDMKESLSAYNFKLEEIPFVIQYNKRDLPNVTPVEELRAALNPMGVPDFEAAAAQRPQAPGVEETLKEVVRQIMTRKQR